MAWLAAGTLLVFVAGQLTDFAQRYLQSGVGSRMAFADAHLLDLTAAGSALYTEDARRAMRRYIDIVSQFETLDLERVLEAASDLRAGQAVEFHGR